MDGFNYSEGEIQVTILTIRQSNICAEYKLHPGNAGIFVG